MSKYTQHPLSAAFPAMSADDYQALKDSVENIGVQNPITLFEGMVLDGWHRCRAASDLDLDCPSVELGDVDPRDFVLAQNKARRHITIAQLAMAANAVYQWRAAGRPAANSAGPAELNQVDIAEKTGVSVRSLRQASQVEKAAAPEVVAAVKSGAVGLEKAAAISKLPKEEQADAIAKPISEIKQKQVCEIVGRPHSELSEAELQQANDAVYRTLAADAEEAAVPEPDYSALDEARDQIQRLEDALVSAMSVSTSQEDREHADRQFAELRNENRSLVAQLSVAEQARDALLNENAAMKRTLAAQRREIEKLKQSVAA